MAEHISFTSYLQIRERWEGQFLIVHFEQKQEGPAFPTLLIRNHDHFLSLVTLQVQSYLSHWFMLYSFSVTHIPMSASVWFRRLA